MKDPIHQLNQEIEHGLQQLDQGQATDPDLLYKKLKDKYINTKKG